VSMLVGTLFVEDHCTIVLQSRDYDSSAMVNLCAVGTAKGVIPIARIALQVLPIKLPTPYTHSFVEIATTDAGMFVFDLVH